MDRDDYSHVMQDQERELYDALRHAERLGLSESELTLLAWASGLSRCFQPKERTREMER